MAKYRCPECGATTFIATAHVTQDWKLDGNGQFLKEVQSCVEVTHSPDEDDVWSCDACGYNAAGKNFRIEEDQE